MSNAHEFDIAVVGGGIVGLSVAALLHNQAYSVVLVDPAEQPPVLPEAYDLRTYALTPASMRVLEKIGAKGALELTRIAQFGAMRVWDADSDGVLAFDAAALGRECLGYIAEHANLMRALHTLLTTLTAIRRIAGRVCAIEQEEDTARLSLDSGATLRARLVLCSDGANSAMRRLLALEPKSHDYAQHAVVCNVEVEHEHDYTARQRFLATGPLAFLPLPEPRACAIVWSTSPGEAARAVAAEDGVFAAMLGAAFDHTLGAIRTTSERLALPLQTLHTGHYVAGRAVLLGDAAHVVHPLAGQGLNLGLMDAAALCEALGPRDALNLRFPRAALRRFERARRGENLAMLKLTYHLNRLFRDERRVTRLLRGAGMSAVGRLLPLKHWLMLRAMGDTGDVPAIASLR